MDELRVLLDSEAASIEEAVRQSSTDHLIEKFFVAGAPFGEMFRAILAFFEASGAREGRKEWEIKVDDEHLDLKHFEHFLRTWDSVSADFDVPDVDWSGAWDFNNVAYDNGMRCTPSFGTSGNDISTDVETWLQAYWQGLYETYPLSLHPLKFAPPFADVASNFMASLALIRKRWPGRKEMLALTPIRERSDGFALGTLAQEETDYRLGYGIYYLSRLSSLDESLREKMARELTEKYAQFPRRKIGIHVDQLMLERILKLPLWQKRYELYAVWIATEIVGAVKDHNCELHHENGKIVFPFRENVVATIKSSSPAVRLYAERRRPLSNPISDERRGNVQPDYSLWRGSDAKEACGLVVEVKHYKRDASSRFRKVLIDYARAHADAQVVLVSHGKASVAFSQPDRDVQNRCHIIGELTVRNREPREALKKLVRDFVGEPALPMPPDAGDTVIALDVSASMSGALGSPLLIDLLGALTGERARALAPVDFEVRAILPMERMAEVVRSVQHGRSTDLTEPVDDLLLRFESVILVTDEGGLKSLKDGTFSTLCVREIEGISVSIVKISHARGSAKFHESSETMAGATSSDATIPCGREQNRE
ncbi:hypothetical protein [Caballeronia pedi]|uniref:hypothetical protein n=1 Tax=Caballeronia pedi TaxID=1777141 RepID=UPI001178AB54|nr:hypothetical protein [Caballeronia pedi]